MRHKFYIILIVLGLALVFHAQAQSAVQTDSTTVIAKIGTIAIGDTLAPTDTVYLFNTWESMLDRKPFLEIQGPIAFENNPCEYIFYTGDKDSQELIEKNTLAINIGDSTWLLNSRYLLGNFKCNYTGFSNFIPVYFSNKIAFVQYWDGYPYSSVWQPITDPNGEEVLIAIDIPNGNPAIYLIDFESYEVIKLNHKTLERILEPYHELYTRYMGMKKRKNDDVVRFFFQKYIDQLDSSPNAPNAKFFP